MLSDRYRQLLTAYVDGELSSRQRRHVVRLLHRSAEARQLLEQLKADARALRQLPPPPLPADFTDPVLRLIAERNVTPHQRRILQAASTPIWIGPLTSWAVAAAVLLTLGIASYVYFVASLGQTVKTEIAQKQPDLPDSTPHVEELGSPNAQRDGETPSEPHEPSAPKIDPSSEVTTPKLVQSDDKPKPDTADKPSASPKSDTALADRVETFHFERVPDLLPVIVKLSDLDQPSARKKLIAELQKDNAFRLELPCTNGTKALDRVQNSGRTSHIGFLIDKTAQERIKLKWKVSYAVYLENVTPEELTGFVRQIEAEDRKSAGGKSTEAQFDRLVLMRMNAGHRKELSTLLGVDPFATTPNTTKSPGADPHNDLADATARQIGQSLAGQGGTPRPESGTPTASPPENIAVVLAYNPARPSSSSDEIKHFLESRKPARPGTVRVLLVLRNG